ncbi:MAG: ribosome recycling factor [Patescibacteria group bacterium]|nr:ribosome recycling factor [Patescibacteria group bacterium]
MKIHELKEKIDERLHYLKQELSSIRTGRANPSLVEEIRVDAYEGSAPLPIKELATVGLSDAATITIKPWDLSILPKIEKALRNAPGGLNPSAYDDLIRINLPPLSQERRQELTKVVSGKVEEVKVEIRRIRQDEMRSLDEMEENGVISQDERFRQREEVEKIVREKTVEVEQIGREKEAEILRV